MASNLESWNDTVGSKFSTAVNQTESYLRDAIKKVNDELQVARTVISKRVNVKKRSDEIKNLVVR